MITRVAIVGLGAAARTIHLPALRQLRRLQVVGGYDTAAPAAAAPFTLYPSVEALLQGAQPDLLVVATPPESHFELVKLGLEAGCHVFCEKPLVDTLEQADALALIAGAAGRHVVVNSEFPWIPIHAAAKARMSRPGFGRLQFACLRQNFVVSGETEAGWRGADPRRTFKEFGTHALDLARFFFDEDPRAIRAVMPRPAGPNTPDLLNLVELSFSGDRVALILLNRLSKGPHRYLEIELDGTEASIASSIGGKLQVSAGLNGRTRRPFLDVQVALGGEARIHHGEHGERLAVAPKNVFADATARLLGEALTAIDSGGKPPNALPDARTTLKLMLAAYQSAEEGGRPIPL